MKPVVFSLIEDMQKGDRRALARLLSYVEEQDETSFEVLQAISEKAGQAITVGITGPSGSGKSTSIDHMIR